MSTDYGSWSLANLKTELKKRKAKITGKKAILVQRLKDYDQLFGGIINDPESVYKVSIPDPEHFRDVTSDTLMPQMNMMDLEAFCGLIQRNYLKTSADMYNNFFLLAMRLALQDGDYFVTGVCCSEMRKNVTYNVTIKAKNHTVLEAQCECAAGMGPYGQCKHILVLLYAMVDHNRDKTYKVKTSCTSNPQRFHHPTATYSGNPLKAEDLKIKTQDQTLKDLTNFDPRPTRPTENTEKYVQEVTNMVINFCGLSKERPMALIQLAKPADKHCAYMDHDYLEKTHEELFLDSLLLNESGRKDLEEKTKIDQKLWKRERLNRIHSSNFGRVCKARGDKRKIAISLMKDNDLCMVPSVKHGLKYEAEAIRQFEALTQLDTIKCGIFVHPDKQFVAATPDRLIGEDCVLEVKCPYTVKNLNISPETVPYVYLCDKTGILKFNIEHDYYYQVQGQLLCTNRKLAYFCIYTIVDLKILLIKRDNVFIENIFANLNSFYDEHFKKVLVDKQLYNKKI